MGKNADTITCRIKIAKDKKPFCCLLSEEVNKLLEDYDTSIKKLSETVGKYQSMVSKILKLVNSAFFGLRSKVNQLRDDTNKALAKVIGTVLRSEPKGMAVCFSKNYKISPIREHHMTRH